MPVVTEPKVINNDDGGFVPMPLPGAFVPADAEAKTPDPIVFQFNDIQALAKKILDRAIQQGQQKIDAAAKLAAQTEKAAFDKGYKEGVEKAQKEGFDKGQKSGMADADKKIQAAIASEQESLRQQASPVVTMLQDLLGLLQASHQELAARAEADLLLLSVDLARRIIRRELSFDPEAIRPIATEAISLVTQRSSIQARVNPVDYAVMEQLVPDLKTLFPDLGAVQIVQDQTINHGDIHVSTRETEIDMRIATALEQFEKAILGYSGPDAQAPWSQIPPEALHAAQQEAAPQPEPPADTQPPADPDPQPQEPMPEPQATQAAQQPEAPLE